jgi:hypothetical protein
MNRKTIVLVLRSGGDFTFKDVELLTKHIHLKWKGEFRPRVICIWDKAKRQYDLGNLTLIPMTNTYPGTWSRIQLYSPEMEQFRPFLYVDLDTAIIQSIENIFGLVKNDNEFIPLEDFYQKGLLATGLVWFPKQCQGISDVWEMFKKTGVTGKRMDFLIRRCIKPKVYWQQLTNSIVDFKPKKKNLLETIDKSCNIVCFHGKPRIFDTNIDWVKQYIKQV